LPINSFLARFVIVILLLLIFAFLSRNLKIFILAFIASRSFFAVFYNVRIFGGFNVLEFAGIFFPAVLLLHWMRNLKSKFTNSGATKVYFLVVFWVSISTLIYIVSHGFGGGRSLSSFIRIINGFSVFIVFPLIFSKKKDIESLLNAFLVSTFFPLVQGLLQMLLKTDILGMGTSVSRGEQADYVMYYGLYHKYDGYAWAALAGGLVLIYKLSISNKRPKRNIYFYQILFGFYLILSLITLSRTLIISMAIVIIFMVLAQKAKALRLVPILLVFLIIGGGFFQSRVQQLITRSEFELKVVRGDAAIEYGFHGRVSLWKDKLQEFNQLPFVNRLRGTDIRIGPHNDYVQWMFTYGYIGVALYILLLLILFTNIFKNIMWAREKDVPYLCAYGLLAFAGIIIWIMEGIIHNVSQYLDYSYMIIGNGAIFLALCRNYSENSAYKNSVYFIKNKIYSGA